MNSFLKKVLTVLRPGRKKGSFKTLAVLGYFDSETEKKICRIREMFNIKCDNSEDEPNRPHVTFLITEDRGIDLLSKRINGLIRRIKLPAVRFSHIGYFPRSKVLFIGITPTNELMRFHAVISNRFDAANEGISPYYMPEKWVPHCSIAEGTDELSIRPDPDNEMGFPFEARIVKISVTEMDHKIGKMVAAIDMESVDKQVPDDKI